MSASNQRVSVLRLGHRRERDKRITSHLGLTARAFGANEVILAGDEDESALDTWRSVSDRFGGDFECRYEPKPMAFLRRFSQDAGDGQPGVIVHLTMYGESWRESLNSIERSCPMVIVVGGTKVSGEVFRLANHNISIGNQPHSEVAALGVFLESFIGPLDESKHFQGGEIQIVPSLDQKQVMSLGEE
ncbi:MAG: tRNA (cytidine(56)-2'-O)-methyltransferase [Candidatus Thermoplasmatota archaeon]|nr:tRNA (cytidine(56)-2'-O)-methyltransferase [Candidatus Thermoplasmatota archaeon]